MSTRLIKNDRLITRAVDWVFGYDFFISYSHSDGTKLPFRLKERLAEAGFRVFLDQTEYVVGLDLRRETRRQVAKSRKLVVIARAGALKSEWVDREVNVALAQAKIPIIVNVNGAVEVTQGSALATTVFDQNWLRLNVTLYDADGELPDSIVSELVRGFNHTRQETKRQRVFALAAAILAIAAGVAIWQAVEATRARFVAEAQRDRAQRVLDQVIATGNRRVHAMTRRLRLEGVEVTASATIGSTSPRDLPLDRANAMIARGSQLLASENLKDASILLGQAEVLLTSRPDAVVADPFWRLALLKVLDRLGVARMREGDLESALALFNRGLSLDDETSKISTRADEWQHVVATLRQDLGELLSSRNQFDDAEQQFRFALDMLHNIARNSRDPDAAQQELAMALVRLGDLLTARSNAQLAIQSYKSALSIIEPIAAKDRAKTEAQRDVSIIYQRMADAQATQKQYDAAIVWVDKDIAIAEMLARNFDEPKLQRDLASSYDRRAKILELVGQNTQSLEEYGKGASLLETIISNNDVPPSWQRDAAAMLESKGRLLATGQPKQAIPVLRRALAIREGLAASFEEMSWQQELEASYKRASETMLKMGLSNESLETAEQYLLAVSLAADNDGSRAERAGRALGTVCWSALNARNFSRALWACSNGIELAPKLGWIKLNYAHALMLSGQQKAARDIYLSKPKDAEAWKFSILNDFDALRKQGIDDPLMLEVENYFGLW